MEASLATGIVESAAGRDLAFRWTAAAGTVRCQELSDEDWGPVDPPSEAEWEHYRHDAVFQEDYKLTLPCEHWEALRKLTSAFVATLELCTPEEGGSCVAVLRTLSGERIEVRCMDVCKVTDLSELLREERRVPMCSAVKILGPNGRELPPMAAMEKPQVSVRYSLLNPLDRDALKKELEKKSELSRSGIPICTVIKTLASTRGH